MPDPDSNGSLSGPHELESWASCEAANHRQEPGGIGCTCGFCVWSIEHVVIMSIRDSWSKAVRCASGL